MRRRSRAVVILVASLAMLAIVLVVARTGIHSAPPPELGAREATRFDGARTAIAESARSGMEGEPAEPVRKGSASDPLVVAGETTPTARVVGRVHGASTGATVSAGTVALSYSSSPPRWKTEPSTRRMPADWSQPTPVVQTHVAPDGSFEVEIPFPGFVSVALVTPDPESPTQGLAFLRTTTWLEPRPLARERPVELDLAVEEGATISGIVVGGARRDPVPDATVTAKCVAIESHVDPGRGPMRLLLDGRPILDPADAEHALGTTRTGVDGRFVLRAVDPDWIRRGLELRAESARYRSGVCAPALSGIGKDVHDVCIELELGAVLSGRIRTADGRAPEDLLALWLFHRRDPPGRVTRLDFLEEALTESEGSFQFPAVPQCMEAILEIADVLPARRIEHLDLTADHAELDVALAPSAPVRLLAQLPAGLVDSALDVLLSSTSRVDEPILRRVENPFARPLAVDVGAPCELSLIGCVEDESGVVLDAHGTATIPPSRPAGPSILEVAVPVLLDGPSARVPVRSRPPGQRQPLNTISIRGFEIDLTARASSDHAGVGVSAFTVADMVDGGETSGFTDDRGRFHVDVRLGRRFLRVRVGGFAPVFFEVESRFPDRAEVALELE